MSNIKTDDTFSTTDRWPCQKCTYLNPNSAYPKCKICNQIDPQLNQHRNIINTPESPTARSTSLSICDRQANDEANAEKLFHDIRLYCQQNNSHFVDDQFPPLPRSIGIDDHSYQWLKISDISPSSKKDHHLEWSVYSSPSPNDIEQGYLGDCWLMAALALITERPKMLEHIVLTKKVNKEGIYLLRICHNGVWKTIIVDDCFPCTQYKQLAYTKASRRQLYVPLIEKACAKLFGSYGNLYGGYTEEGLQLLTGAPCDHIDLIPKNYKLDSNIVWAKLLSACESQLLIGATTGRTDVTQEEYNRVHIHGNHAFSILCAFDLSHISMQFVLVRDPHARTNYREAFITKSVLEQLNSILPFRLPSGAFWISWPLFLNYFTSITISSYVSDHYDVREVAKFTQSSKEPVPTFRFYVHETSTVNISLIYHRKKRRSVVYHTQSFILCNVEDEQSQNVGTHVAILKTKRGAFVSWTGPLRPGSYVLIPFSTSFWDEKYLETERNYTLVLHSKIRIDVQVIKEPATVLADCLITFISKKYPVQRCKDFNYYVTTGVCDVMIFIAENLSLTDYLNLDIDMSDGKYIRNSRRSFITHDCIPPHHKQIVFLIEWANEQDQQAKMNYGFQFSHVRKSNNSVPSIDVFQNDFHSFRSF